MAKLAQSATAAPETKLTLVRSHLNGFMGHRAKAFSGRDSLERAGRRLMTLRKMPPGVRGTDYFVPVLSITIFSRFRGKSRAVASRAAPPGHRGGGNSSVAHAVAEVGRERRSWRVPPPGQRAKRKRSIDELIMALAS